MISFALTNYGAMCGNLEKQIGMYMQLALLNPESATQDIGLQQKYQIANSIASFVAQEARRLQLEHTLQMATQLNHELNHDRRFSPELLVRELIKIKQLIVMESSKRRLAFIPPPYDKYFEQEKLFGDAVYEQIESARQDLKDAGNCLAASLPTASVFHLMRVAEHGLRKLAKKLRVKLIHSGKSCPIEFADWDKMITAIRNKIAHLRKLSAGTKKQNKLEAYSNAADHCEYMKDIWRNNMAHTRNPYKDAEAVAVLERVRDFMQFLARHLA